MTLLSPIDKYLGGSYRNLFTDPGDNVINLNPWFARCYRLGGTIGAGQIKAILPDPRDWPSHFNNAGIQFFVWNWFYAGGPTVKIYGGEGTDLIDEISTANAEMAVCTLRYPRSTDVPAAGTFWTVTKHSTLGR